jgi:protease IV
MRKTLGTVFIILIVFFFAGCFMMFANLSERFPKEAKVKESALLHLRLDGIILDPSDFLEDLRKYAKDEHIKGVLIEINSPGGVVGPSQELYSELKRVRDEFKKPVVVASSALLASGAFYAAVAASKIYVNPGTLVGSIGVIMEFANLQKLYDWAKIERYSIKTGAYKDSGAEYRPMREDERRVFQSMADEVLTQFVEAVAKGRNLDREVVRPLADGRVFTGEAALKLGLVDKVGTFEDARREAGQLAQLGPDPDLFEPPSKRSLEDFLSEIQGKFSGSMVDQVASRLGVKLWGQPLLLLPGSIPSWSESRP